MTTPHFPDLIRPDDTTVPIMPRDQGGPQWDEIPDTYGQHVPGAPIPSHLAQEYQSQDHDNVPQVQRLQTFYLPPTLLSGQAAIGNTILVSTARIRLWELVPCQGLMLIDGKNTLKYGYSFNRNNSVAAPIAMHGISLNGLSITMNMSADQMPLWGTPAYIPNANASVVDDVFIVYSLDILR